MVHMQKCIFVPYVLNVLIFPLLLNVILKSKIMIKIKYKPKILYKNVEKEDYKIGELKMEGSYLLASE